MSFPRYPNYKDSGVAWLGEVPEHWELPKLKTIASFSGGGTPNRENRDYWNGEIPWVSPKDMKSERIINSEESITQDGLMNSSSNLLQSGHVLMVVRSGILKHTIPIAINDVAVSLNQDMKALNFDIEKCLGQFFFRWVQGLNNQLLLAWAKQGATVESIEHSYLVDTVVPLPSIDEQIIVISFLDRETAKIDALVAEQQRLIELLKEKRQAVISHAVTKGLDPTVPMKPSGIEWLGDIPAHWMKIRLRNLFRQEKRQDHLEREVLSVYRDYGVIPKSSRDDNMNKTPDDLSLYQLVNPGDLVINKMKAWQGSLGISRFEGITSPDYVVFSSKNPECASFLHLLLRSRPMVSVYLGISNGIRPSQWRLEPDLFLSLYVFMPPLQEQKDIASFIEREILEFETLTAEAERAIELLQERRTALISAAVTGQIDVRQLAQGVAA